MRPNLPPMGQESVKSSVDDYIAALETVERATRFAQRPLKDPTPLPGIRLFLTIEQPVPA